MPHRSLPAPRATAPPGARRTRPSRRRRAARALAVAWLPALAACGSNEAAEAPEGVLVDTTAVATEDVPRRLRAVGTVEAENQTTVAAEVDGQVSRIVAEEGAVVRAGQLVLEIDPTPFRLQVQEAQAALARAEAALANDRRLLERYEKLLAAGALDQQSFDDVQARVRSEEAEAAAARAQLAQARWSLGKSSVRAPFDGRIADRLVDLGTYVGDGDPLFQIVDAQPVRVAFELPETSVGALEEGDRVAFAVRTSPGRAFEGEIVYVSPALSPETRTQPAKAEYPNEGNEVPPGAFADLVITTDVRRGAPVIPEEALVTEGEQNFVYVIEAGRASKREVTLGERLQGRLEVATGLEGGEVLVTEGHRELFDGAPVRYVEAPAAPAGEVGPGRE